MPDGSITHCLELLRHGDVEATRFIWQRYFPRLVRLAREQLAATPRQLADEEDVALSALDRFCRAAQQGQFPDLADRDGLWRLLLRITMHRALDLVRRQQRLRRGGNGVPGSTVGADSPERREECFPHMGPLSAGALVSDEPDPQFAAQMAEECRRLLDRLDDAGLQALAIAKMEGYCNREIADRLECSERTVERRLRLIRDLWRAKEPL